MVGLVRSKGNGSLRALQPTRDLRQLAALIENAFGDELTQGGERVLRELRFLSWLGPLNVLFTGLSSDVDGILTGLVWERDGRIVGSVTVNHPTGDPQRWQISNVAVLDRYRGQGIGRRLMEAAIDLVLRRGAQTAYLFVRDSNEAALSLYQGLGFTEVDRATDLEFAPHAVRVPPAEVKNLRVLKPGDGQALYQLVNRAIGAGQRWLSPVRRDHYVLSPDERLLRSLGSGLAAQVESRWDRFVGEQLVAAVSLQATRRWNWRPHRLKAWVHPSWRGQVEDELARDVVALLARCAPRSTQCALPACEQRAIEALSARGFRQIRTLILMRLDL